MGGAQKWNYQWSCWLGYQETPTFQNIPGSVQSGHFLSESVTNIFVGSRKDLQMRMVLPHTWHKLSTWWEVVLGVW